MGTKVDVLPGQVVVNSSGNGWWFVQIGRARYAKRFNISDAEARALVQELLAVLK